MLAAILVEVLNLTVMLAAVTVISAHTTLFVLISLICTKASAFPVELVIDQVATPDEGVNAPFWAVTNLVNPEIALATAVPLTAVVPVELYVEVVALQACTCPLASTYTPWLAPPVAAVVDLRRTRLR